MATTMAGDASVPVLHSVDMEAFNYVFDWAGASQLALDDDGTLVAASQTLLALPAKFSLHAGIPGHYLINAAGGVDEQAIRLPAVVEHVDQGVPDLLAIAAKLAANQKLYLVTINLPLNLGKSKDGKEQWASDERPQLLKLELVKHFKAVQNFDGCALRKQADAWVSKWSTFFKPLKITNLADVHNNWGAAGRFEANLSVICAEAEVKLRKSAKKSAGGRIAGQKQSEAAGSKVNYSVESAIAEQRVKILRELEAQLRTKVPYVHLPLSRRIIHLQIEPPAADSTIDVDSLSAAVEAANPKFAANIIQRLKDGAALALASGGAPAATCGSPVRVPPAPEEGPSVEATAFAASHQADTTESAAKEFCDLSSENEGDGDEANTAAAAGDAETGPPALRKSGRPIVPPKALVMEMTAKAKPKAKKSDSQRELGANLEADAADEDVQPKKRPYKRSGLYSRDPIKAAQARSKSISAKTPRKQHAGTPHPPCNPRANSLICANSAHFACTGCLSTTSSSLSRSSAGGGSEGDDTEQGKMLELNMKLVKAEGEMAALKIELEAAKAKLQIELESKELAVAKATAEAKLEMHQAIELAREKGYAMAMKHLGKMKALLGPSKKSRSTFSALSSGSRSSDSESEYAPRRKKAKA